MENALVILCGGNSTRMGTDKALLPFGDTCLIEYLVRKFQPYFSRIYLSVKIKGDYSHLKLPVTEIPDIYPNQGPMSGIFYVCRHSVSGTENRTCPALRTR